MVSDEGQGGGDGAVAERAEVNVTVKVEGGVPRCVSRYVHSERACAQEMFAESTELMSQVQADVMPPMVRLTEMMIQRTKYHKLRKGVGQRPSTLSHSIICQQWNQTQEGIMLFKTTMLVAIVLRVTWM